MTGIGENEFQLNAHCISCNNNDVDRCMEDYGGGTTCYVYPYYSDDSYCRHGITTTEECPSIG